MTNEEQNQLLRFAQKAADEAFNKLTAEVQDFININLVDICITFANNPNDPGLSAIFGKNTKLREVAERWIDFQNSVEAYERVLRVKG